MIELLIIYLAVALFGAFVVVPFLRARTSLDSEEVLILGLIGSVVWPLAIVVIIGYHILWLPGVWLFGKSEAFFAPKPPIPPPPPPVVNVAKSTYRHVEFVTDDQEYSSHREI
jgi:hypothetical protein